MSTPKVALQMYTVRDELVKDFAGTFRTVSALGYPGVQMAGYGNMAAADLKALLDELNLEVAGSHIGIDALENNLEREIAYCKELGTIDLVCPFLPKERIADLDGWRQVARSLDKIGATCNQAGMRLSYHNHAFEFVKFDNQFALDLLLNETDPQHVYFEPDVYWIQYGGQDPAAYIQQYTGRCPLIHLKDMAPGESRAFAEIGLGILNFEPIFQAAEAGGAEWYIVEQDRTPGPSLDSARMSLENLRRMGKL